MSEPGLRLSVYIGETDQWHGRPLFTEIVHQAHTAGLAGATVLRGIEGFGLSHRIHTARLLSFSDDLPVVIVIVDRADRIRAFLPQLEGLIGEGLAVLDEVEIIHYGSGHA